MSVHAKPFRIESAILNGPTGLGVSCLTLLMGALMRRHSLIAGAEQLVGVLTLLR